MIDLIRQSQAPANVMRAASKGALNLPAGEMIEILVYLTTNPLFAEQAKMTLAGWDEASSIAACQDANTPRAVLDYFVSPDNHRPKLIPALLDNPAVPEAALMEMAQTASRELVDSMLASARVQKSPHILHSLGTNIHLTPEEGDRLKAVLQALGEQTVKLPAYEEVGEEGKTQYELEHAAEIAAEEGKAFELVGGTLHDEDSLAAAAALQIAPEAIAPPTASAAPVPAAAVDEKTLKMREAEAGARERLSPLQKISRLTVGERVQLAMRGNKEERFILIRDGSKVVSSAVLQSPKMTDAEVETFAGMKNVQESVLRDIARTKKFMKNYAVVRSLVNNPRCPLDLSLGLMGHLLVNDLKALSMNKNIADTLRKLAMKRFKEKSAPPGSKKE
ncbi:MAG TPA: hypothetical protein VE825_11070 [Terriglobales bacterium]|nr:hypothetical protein [Terriglobales bacterium]